MNPEEVAELTTSLSELCLAQAGQVAALRTVIDALIATVGTNLPPLTEVLSAHLGALAALNRGSLEDRSLNAFDATIADVQGNLRILQGS
jgi:hypothetical protein